MLNITIKSYDSHFDTFHIALQEDDGPAFESLIPATLLPYIAPELCATCEDLPFDVVGQSFKLTHPL
jgi:hypothetical protein